MGHKTPITACRFSSSELVSGSRDGTIIIWHTPTERLMRECRGHTTPVTCIQFDAVKIVSGSNDGTIIVHDIATGDAITSLRGHTNKILALQFDSLKVLSVSADNTMRFWEWVSVYSTVEIIIFTEPFKFKSLILSISF